MQTSGPHDDDAIRAAVMRLSRPHASGGRVIERAAVLAAGPDASAIMTWVAKRGEPEDLTPRTDGQGIHGLRASAADPRRPLRYVIPVSELTGDDRPPA